MQAVSARRWKDHAFDAAFSAARATAEVAIARQSSIGADGAYVAAAAAMNHAFAAATLVGTTQEFLEAFHHDELQMHKGGDGNWKQVVEAPLWQPLPANLETRWNVLSKFLRGDGDHWSVWIDWYNARLAGRKTTEIEDAAFTDLSGTLPWDEGAGAVNVEIGRRLIAMEPDPSPVEGITSPITIDRQPDGRIGVEAGPFSSPSNIPNSAEQHRSALIACRDRAGQLIEIASSAKFQGRSEYAQILTDYVRWLPTEAGTGNILLADGEARVLNKLFAAEEPILPPVFASKLSVLLEDQIGLRSHYPEVLTHYQAVSTGRLIQPLSRDAIDAIQKVIHSQTPTVFNESITPAIDAAAKPIPELKALSSEDLPPPDPNRPKPPLDPIVDADPLKSRNYILASAFNRIWSILQKGKDTAQAIEGWQKTYQLMKPHIGQIIEFLKPFLRGADGSGGPTLPPTIGA